MAQIYQNPTKSSFLAQIPSIIPYFHLLPFLFDVWPIFLQFSLCSLAKYQNMQAGRLSYTKAAKIPL